MREFVRLLVLLPVLGSVPLVAIGAEPCTNPVNSAEIAECGDRDAQAAEKELNVVYQQVMKGLGRAESDFGKDFPNMKALQLRANLIAAEREWLKYRAQSCKLEGQVVLSGNPSRGDFSGIAETACQAQFARARVGELKRFAKIYDIQIDP